MVQAETIVGPQSKADGSQLALRSSRTGAGVVADAHGRYQEATIRSNVYSLVLTATTTGVAAGNIAGAAAAAATQFVLWNPSASQKALVLLKFGMGVISGTPGAGPMFHGIITTVPTIASIGGPAVNNLTGAGTGSVAKFVASAAGTALTGGGAPTTLRLADFASTATAQASVGELRIVEYIDGEIILPPSVGWVPLWGAAGTSLLNGYSITWEEVPYP